MAKSVKLVVEDKDGDQIQVMPETEADNVFNLTEKIKSVVKDSISEALKQNFSLPAGTDLNKITSNGQGTKTYSINGVKVFNAPFASNQWASLTVTDINVNTSTQLFIDSFGNAWVRGAGGAKKKYTDWKYLNEEGV